MTNQTFENKIMTKQILNALYGNSSAIVFDEFAQGIMDQFYKHNETKSYNEGKHRMNTNVIFGMDIDSRIKHIWIPFDEQMRSYIEQDVESVKQVLNSFYGFGNLKREGEEDMCNGNCKCADKISKYSIEKVLFNDPCTIVWFTDGDKVVVKTDGKDKFDPEVGFAMAIMKKMYGTRSQFSKVIAKEVKRCEDEKKAKADKKKAKKEKQKKDDRDHKVK